MPNQTQVLELLNQQFQDETMNKLAATVIQGYSLNEMILNNSIFSAPPSRDLRPHIRRYCVGKVLYEFATSEDSMSASYNSNSTGNSRFTEIKFGNFLITPHFVRSIKSPPSWAKYRHDLAQMNLFSGLEDDPEFSEFFDFPEFNGQNIYVNLVYTGRREEPTAMGLGIPDVNSKGWYFYKELPRYPKIQLAPIEIIADELILELRQELKLKGQE